MRKFDVALSFAGEQRDFVSSVANKLSLKGLKVFYDKHDQHKALGCEPYNYFGQIYSREAYLVVLFVSKEYMRKDIPMHEAKSAMENNNNNIIVFRFDDVSFENLKSRIYMDIDERSEEDIAELVENSLIEKGLVFENDNDEEYEIEHIPTGEATIKFSFFDDANNQVEYKEIYAIDGKKLWKKHIDSNVYKCQEIYGLN